MTREETIEKLCAEARALAHEELRELMGRTNVSLLGRPVTVALVLQGLLTRIADSEDTGGRFRDCDAGVIVRSLAQLLRAAAEDAVGDWVESRATFDLPKSLRPGLPTL